MINNTLKTDVCTFVCNRGFISLLNNIKYYTAIRGAKWSYTTIKVYWFFHIFSY